MTTDYARLASKYDQDRTHFHGASDETLAAAWDSRPNFRALDIGCGTGLWIATQQKHFATITFCGVEPSPAMRNEALAKTTDVEIALGSAESLPFPDSHFDFVTTQFTFHHFADKPAAVREIVRVLRPDGTFKLTNLDPQASRDWYLYEFFPWAMDYDAKRFWTTEQMCEEFAEAGLSLNPTITPGPMMERDIALAECERRITSQLADMPDPAFQSGLAKVRQDQRAQYRGPSIVTATSG